MAAKSYLVTGGTGFLGSALVRRLIESGHAVRVFDNNSRGALRRLEGLEGRFEFIQGDIRDPEAVAAATKGVESVVHMAFINGTEFFYSMPERVLDVGVKGMVNVLDACLKHEIPELAVASSSEVYHLPPVVPTDETVPLVIPDPHNPRFSYAAGKMISEIMAINYGRKHFERVLIFRPHNIYGPDMGWEHVIPQFILRMIDLTKKGGTEFPIRGSGKATRAFCYIDDFTEGLLRVLQRGQHLGIYHIGATEEVSIRQLAELIGACFQKELDIRPGEEVSGETPRRCPNIERLNKLGYQPRYRLSEGVRLCVDWYRDNQRLRPVEASAGVSYPTVV